MAKPDQKACNFNGSVGRINRCEFISALGGAAAWPVVARAQQAERMRRVVFLHALAESDAEVQARITVFRQGLAALGWTENGNVQIEHRFSGGDLSRMKAYAVELTTSPPDLIITSGTSIVVALKQATRTIPIVFCVTIDPVGQGLVAGLARPGGNITGFTSFDFPIIGKWLEMLKAIAPDIRRITFVFSPATAPWVPFFMREFGAVPPSLAVELSQTPVRDEAEIGATVTAFAREPGGGLIVAPDPFMNAHRALVMALAARYRLPAIYGFRQFATEGGLISYGPDTGDIVRRSASYVDRILKGEKPAELPVQAPTKFELVINLKTAKAIGLDVPLHIQQLADEAIE
jgi:putative ABC transport system substrate-binding protein